MHIDSYSFGRIVIDGEQYTSDLIILQERVEGSWWRKDGHRLSLDDLAEVISSEPQLLIIGTGAYGVMKVADEIINKLRLKGIEVAVEKTADAVEHYNIAARTGNVVAALHLTC